MSRRSRHSAFDLGPIKDSQYKFMRQVAKAAAEIKKHAKGKLCGDCMYFAFDCCNRYKSLITGNWLECSAAGVACKGFVKKKDLHPKVKNGTPDTEDANG